MATLKLTDLATCKSYFSNIASLHKQIDTFRWGEKDLIQKNNRSNLGARILWVKPYDGADYQGDGTDNIIKNKVLELRYMLPIQNNQEAREAAATDTEAVIEQILAKMFRDKRGEIIAGAWTAIVFRVSAIKTDLFEITIASTLYAGCELQITFQDNTHLAYDETKWNPEP
jgi:hypothetical protein